MGLTMITYSNSINGTGQTYVDTDLAINGAGWFILRSPTTGQIYVTRSH